MLAWNYGIGNGQLSPEAVGFFVETLLDLELKHMQQATGTREQEAEEQSDDAAEGNDGAEGEANSRFEDLEL